MKTFIQFNETENYGEPMYSNTNRITLNLYSYNDEENDFPLLERDIKKLEENNIYYIIISTTDNYINSTQFQTMFKIYALPKNKEQRDITYYNMNFSYNTKINIEYNGENLDEVLDAIKKRNKNFSIINKEDLYVIINSNKFNI